MALPGAQPIPALNSFTFHRHALAAETAVALLHIQESSWRFPGFFWGSTWRADSAGSSPVAGGGIAMAIVTWETERYRRARAAVLSLLLSRLAQSGIQPW